MKHKLLLILLMLPVMMFAQQAEDYLKAGETIKFSGTKYFLGWSSHPNSDYFIQEYYPKGEKPESYNQMFTLSLHQLEGLTPEIAVKAKEKELEERKKTDACCNYCVMENNGEYMIDFLVSAPDKNDPGSLSVVEFDIHRYRTVTVNGKKSLQLLFYSRRAYGDDITPFLQDLGKTREKFLLEMVQTDVAVH